MIDVTNFEELVARWPHIRLDQIPSEYIAKMTPDTLDLFNTMVRDGERRNGWVHRINSTWRKPGTGQHPLGRAIDFVFYTFDPGDVNVLTQYNFVKTYAWGGIGIYPEWNAPGLHVDTRQGGDHIATWFQDKFKAYHSLAQYEDVYGVKIV